VASRADLIQPERTIVPRLNYLRRLANPETQSGPRGVEVPRFVAPANGKHVQQDLFTTCGATIAFNKEATMQVTVGRCAGLDVHQASVVACGMIHGRGKKPTREVRSFGTMTHELEALRDWLKAEGVTHVGMESTGVYWRAVHAVLEDHVTLIVGNPSAGIPAATRPEPWPPSPVISATCPAARRT
jgi:hypothetical protein